MLSILKKGRSLSGRIKTALLDFYFLRIPILFHDTQRIIIVRIDSIGDYILFRNFLHETASSEKYKGKKLCLIGNLAWKDLAEKYDNGIIDTFIWFSPEIYKRKYHFLKSIRQLKATEIINPIQSRTAIDDDIVKYSGAKLKIGTNGDTIRMSPDKKKLQDRIYHHLHPALPISEFEFLRNRFFFENLLGKSLSLQKPVIEQGERKPVAGRIIIFPGAQVDFRKWPADHFAALIDSLQQKYDCQFIICGGPSDKEVARKIMNAVTNTSKVTSLAGNTSLPELIELISNAALLVSNETSAVHISVAVNTPVVCISNGNHFGRFNPYPAEVSDLVYTVYPDDSFYDTKNYLAYNEKFKMKSDLDIRQIGVERVEQAVALLVNKFSLFSTSNQYNRQA
jgi:ADP-heptose:LPS heptosyltransferase